MGSERESTPAARCIDIVLSRLAKHTNRTPDHSALS